MVGAIGIITSRPANTHICGRCTAPESLTYVLDPTIADTWTSLPHVTQQHCWQISDLSESSSIVRVTGFAMTGDEFPSGFNAAIMHVLMQGRGRI